MVAVARKKPTHPRGEALHTVPEAAELLGRGVRGTWDLIWRKELGHYVLAGRTFVSERHIAAYFDKQERKPASA